MILFTLKFEFKMVDYRHTTQCAPRYLTFNRHKSTNEAMTDQLTTIQACDTNENISSHL